MLYQEESGITAGCETEAITARPGRIRHTSSRMRPRYRRRSATRDAGFTLIELLIVLAIIPIIIGSIAVALLATFRVQAGVSDRLSQSADTQITSANYFRDIQNAAEIFAPSVNTTTGVPASTALPQCGTTAPILSVQWPESSGLATVVSYSVTTNGYLRPGVTQYELVRSYCSNVGTTTAATNPTSTSVLAGNVPIALASAINCASGDTICTYARSSAAAGYSSTDSYNSAGTIENFSFENISLTVDQANSNPSNYSNSSSFTLAATPRISNAGLGNGVLPYPNISPLELLGTDVLSTCPSRANFNINGPILMENATSGKSTISTSSVYWYNPGGSQPSTDQFVNSGGTPAYPPFTRISSYSDPLQNLTPPNIATLPTNPPMIGDVYQPGIYTTALGGANLAPGVYYFSGAGAGVDLKSNDVLGGRGVMLYFTNSASMHLQAGSTIALTPATSGPYADITIWQAKDDNQDATLKGQVSTLGLTGVVYLPGATLALSGTSTFYASDLVARDITCNGGGGGSIDLNYNYPPKTLPTLTLTKTPPANASVGDTAKIFATSTNNKGNANPVTYTIDMTSTSNCSVSGNTVTFTSVGKCIVDVNQLGSIVTNGNGTTNYFAAYELQTTTTVSAG